MTEFFTRLCHPNNIVHDIWSANSLSNAGPVTSREGFSVVLRTALVLTDGELRSAQAFSIAFMRVARFNHYVVIHSLS